MFAIAADKVPPKVKLPEVVTVPLSVKPETLPVPLTEVTVPLPPAGVAHCPSPRRKVVLFAVPLADI
jgi:hypothetical protein